MATANDDSKNRYKKGKRKGKLAPKAFRKAQWKPGQSGNPKGVNGSHTMQLSMVRKLKEILGSKCVTIHKDSLKKLGLHKDATVADAIVIMAAIAAMRGEYQFFREIMDRIDGKVIEKVEHSGGLTLSEITAMAAKARVLNEEHDGDADSDD